MRIVLSVLILLLTIPTGQSSEIAELERALRTSAGLEADFVQSFTPQGFKRAQVERGKVTFGAPPRMRWSYSSPEPKLFVFDGATSWFYTPDEGQVTITKITDAQKKELPFLFMADPALVGRTFTVQERKSRSEVVTRLGARDKAALIRQATITSSAEDHLIRRLEYRDRQGNRTVFEFSNYKKAPASAAQFQFVPPPDVEIIQQ